MADGAVTIKAEVKGVSDALDNISRIQAAVQALGAQSGSQSGGVGGLANGGGGTPPMAPNPGVASLPSGSPAMGASGVPPIVNSAPSNTGPIPGAPPLPPPSPAMSNVTPAPGAPPSQPQPQTPPPPASPVHSGGHPGHGLLQALGSIFPHVGNVTGILNSAISGQGFGASTAGSIIDRMANPRVVGGLFGIGTMEEALRVAISASQPGYSMDTQIMSQYQGGSGIDAIQMSLMQQRSRISTDIAFRGAMNSGVAGTLLNITTFGFSGLGATLMNRESERGLALADASADARRLSMASARFGGGGSSFYESPEIAEIEAFRNRPMGLGNLMPWLSNGIEDLAGVIPSWDKDKNKNSLFGRYSQSRLNELRAKDAETNRGLRSQYISRRSKGIMSYLTDADPLSSIEAYYAGEWEGGPEAAYSGDSAAYGLLEMPEYSDIAIAATSQGGIRGSEKYINGIARKDFAYRRDYKGLEALIESRAFQIKLSTGVSQEDAYTQARREFEPEMKTAAQMGGIANKQAIAGSRFSQNQALVSALQMDGASTGDVSAAMLDGLKPLQEIKTLLEQQLEVAQRNGANQQEIAAVRAALAGADNSIRQAAIAEEDFRFGRNELRTATQGRRGSISYQEGLYGGANAAGMASSFEEMNYAVDMRIRDLQNRLNSRTKPPSPEEAESINQSIREARFQYTQNRRSQFQLGIEEEGATIEAQGAYNDSAAQLASRFGDARQSLSARTAQLSRTRSMIGVQQQIIDSPTSTYVERLNATGQMQSLRTNLVTQAFDNQRGYFDEEISLLGGRADLQATGRRTMMIEGAGIGSEGLGAAQTAQITGMRQAYAKANEQVNWLKSTVSADNPALLDAQRRAASIRSGMADASREFASTPYSAEFQDQMAERRYRISALQSIPGTLGNLRGEYVGMINDSKTMVANNEEERAQLRRDGMLTPEADRIINQRNREANLQGVQAFSQLSYGWQARTMSTLVNGSGSLAFAQPGLSMRAAVGAGVRNPFFGSNTPGDDEGAMLVKSLAGSTGTPAGFVATALTGARPGPGFALPRGAAGSPGSGSAEIHLSGTAEVTAALYALVNVLKDSGGGGQAGGSRDMMGIRTRQQPEAPGVRQFQNGRP